MLLTENALKDCLREYNYLKSKMELTIFENKFIKYSEKILKLNSLI